MIGERENRLVNALLRLRPGTPDLMFLAGLLRGQDRPLPKQLHRLLSIAYKYRRDLPANLVPEFKPPPRGVLGEFYAHVIFAGGQSIAEASRRVMLEYGPESEYFTRMPERGLPPFRRY